MQNKRGKIVANLIASGLVLHTVPVQAKESKINMVEENINEIGSQENTNNKIDDEVLEENLTVNVIEGSEYVIEVGEGEYISSDLKDNPQGYEKIIVKTTGNKKLVKTDYDNLRLSKIPKIDLSDAISDDIPANAFSGAKYLIEFKFPKGILSIGFKAFNNCSGLKCSLDIPDSVTKIESYAFNNCSGFTGSLNIPNSVTKIEKYAFFNCSGFTGSLNIPDGLTEIESLTFANCSGFTGSLNIPNSVTKIGNSAFNSCSGLTGSLNIPDSVTQIGDGAFVYCSGLTGSLNIPDSVTQIGNSVFNGCSGLTGSLNIPDSVTQIGDYAFKDCSGLTGNLVIPDSVTEIGNYAFYNCSGLTGSLNIPDSVTEIGNYAFYNCSGLTGSLNIPDSVTQIGDSVFNGCSGLTGNLVIPDSVTEIGNYAFYNCSGLTGSLNIPDSVTEIGNYAFYNCSGLTGSLNIPDSVTRIRRGTFYNCNGLTGNLVIPDSVTEIQEWAFDYLNIDKIIVRIDETFKENEYRKKVVENLPMNKTYLEVSYNLDYDNTWLNDTSYKKAIKVYADYGLFKNNEGMGTVLEILTPYDENNISVTKDKQPYKIPKSENGKYLFKEEGDYEINVVTELGTVSKISFKNNIPVLKPSIENVNGKINIVDNGGYSKKVNEINETFDKNDDVKFEFSNPNWLIDGGMLKSESIENIYETENELKINSPMCGEIEIGVKVRTSSFYNRGMILINDEIVYKSNVNMNDFEKIRFELKEGENVVKFIFVSDEYYNDPADDNDLIIDYINVFNKNLEKSSSDFIEYRVNNGYWTTYENSFDIKGNVNEKVVIEAKANIDGFESEIDSKEIEITDNEKPKINYNIEPGDWTNEKVVINVKASDDVGVENIILPNLNKINSDTTEYEVYENGEYTFTAIDTSGKTEKVVVKVNNIDKKAPVIEYSIDKNNDKSVTIDFDIVDDLSGVKSFISDSNLIDLKGYRCDIDKNGEYKFIATDNAGNTSNIVIKIENLKESESNENVMKPENPETGDNIVKKLGVYVILMIMSFLGLLKKIKNYNKFK